jgi:hypothetical protein
MQEGAKTSVVFPIQTSDPEQFFDDGAAYLFQPG